jgi:hypothetical protein
VFHHWAAHVTRFEGNTFAAVLPKSETGHNALPVCLGNENPHRLVSLWDIVNEFSVVQLATHVNRLGTMYIKFAVDGLETDLQVSRIVYKRVVAVITEARDFCELVGFEKPSRKISQSLFQLKDRSLVSNVSLSVEIRNIVESIISETADRRFLMINPDRVNYVDEPKLLGDRVPGGFPSAVPDIVQAGNCLAAECPTAAVFHLMRSVEWGLRALATELGIRRLRCRNKKTGKVKYMALPWAEWEVIINTIKSRIAERITKASRGPKKQQYQEFYNPLVDNIERFKDAYRNHVMHTRREYTRLEAFGIFDQVRHFMTRLATSVSEC